MAKSKSYGGLIVLVIVLAAAAGGAWYYFRGKSDAKPEFQTTKIARGDITQAVTATGDLQPVITVDIGAQVSGQIEEVLVDFNSMVKAGDVLARIDESTPTQRLRQAEADLASAEASNQLIQINAQRTKDLFAKNLVSQQELDSASAQLAQSNANLLTRQAAVANARLDLERTVITAPIDGMVLNRNTDKGRTVNASMNAPTLFTLVNDLTKMQINAAVAEADIGAIAEGQEVKFTVDAFPNRTFNGTVRQVRNAATTTQNVVSYATIIDVNNPDLKLKPGMTANVSIVVQQRLGVLRVENGALRVRIPQELLPKTPAPSATGPGGVVAGAGEKPKSAADSGAATSMTDEERRAAMMSIMREIGFERDAPISAEQLEKAKTLAKNKGVDPEFVVARLANPGARMTRGPRGEGGGGGGGRRMAGGNNDRGFNTPVITRTLYKFADPDALEKQIVPVNVRLGISDGFYTEVLAGLDEGDVVIKNVTMPGAAPVVARPAGGGMQNPFSGGGRGPMRRGG